MQDTLQAIIPDIEERTKEKWEYTYELQPPLKPKFKVICLTCFLNELLWGKSLGELLSKIDEFEMYWKSATAFDREYSNPKAHRWRIYMHYKCMRCFDTRTFGVPVSKDYWDWLRHEIYEKTGKYNVVVEAAEVYE
ncbi:hypothetical protein [Archaeoglobus veneficus]|uniref:Uncharacterized protein n=1 Tax=Archaeoglobus veneficus (strain DSM 11195 / SNP6) TaxID=693661 RepID=F2KRT9_ARCVS|nr:hypothetical protein [Archaeoglobus veneficus]AEA47953.1 hypothetical protein Arcve_1960 [Archaeoglobus veneficus SNP6]